MRGSEPAIGGGFVQRFLWKKRECYGRQIVVVLTQQGKEESGKIRSRVLSFVSAMLEELGPEDAEAYIRIQKKIWMNYQQGHSVS